ncbi:hypothetical protein Purlil1_7957 [Purpureocillium lilacinum]|uniref:Uncharacterized protein n=1 Tax=Purpureocillium lilacinum TaxID=33203 RepID=A0ABR0BUB1_PURLI|nr:hypothetical protein Purlil1_7957 [Purpureocillium lilacinum]
MGAAVLPLPSARSIHPSSTSSLAFGGVGALLGPDGGGGGQEGGWWWWWERQNAREEKKQRSCVTTQKTCSLALQAPFAKNPPGEASNLVLLARPISTPQAGNPAARLQKSGGRGAAWPPPDVAAVGLAANYGTGRWAERQDPGRAE